MMDLEGMITEVRGVIAAAWPEVVPNGIWEAEQAERLPEAKFTLPYAVFRIPFLPGSQPEPGQLLFEPTVEILYVDASRGSLAPLRGKLLTLMRAFWPVNPLTTATVTGVPVLSYSTPSEHNTLFGNRGTVWANQYFAQKGSFKRAGMIQITLKLQESP